MTVAFIRNCCPKKEIWQHCVIFYFYAIPQEKNKSTQRSIFLCGYFYFVSLLSRLHNHFRIRYFI